MVLESASLGAEIGEEGGAGRQAARKKNTSTEGWGKRRSARWLGVLRGAAFSEDNFSRICNTCMYICIAESGGGREKRGP